MFAKDPRRASNITKRPAGRAHATSEIAIGRKPAVDATKRIPGEGFKRLWPTLIKVDEAVKAKVKSLFGDVR